MKKLTLTSLLLLTCGCNTPVLNSNPRAAIEDLEGVAKERLEGQTLASRHPQASTQLPHMMNILDNDTTTQGLWNYFLGTDYGFSPYLVSLSPTLDAPPPQPRKKDKVVLEIEDKLATADNTLEEKYYQDNKSLLKSVYENIAFQKTLYFFNYPQERPFRFAQDSGKTVLVMNRIGLPINLYQQLIDPSQRASIMLKDHFIPALKSIRPFLKDATFDKIAFSVTYGIPNGQAGGLDFERLTTETTSAVFPISDIDLVESNPADLIKKSRVFQSRGLFNMVPISGIDLSI